METFSAALVPLWIGTVERQGFIYLTTVGHSARKSLINHYLALNKAAITKGSQASLQLIK